MRILKEIILLFIVTFVFFCAKSQEGRLNKVAIYYLPWDLHTQGRLGNEDVRNYNSGENDSIIITQDSIKLELISALSIFNLRFFMEERTIDVRMVIDFYYETGIKTISLDKKRHILFDKSVYFRNIKLDKFLNANVPR